MIEIKQAEGARLGAAYGEAITSAVLRETAVWTDAQRQLLSGVGTIWSDWLKRRCEAVEAASRSMQRIMVCRNFSDLAEAQHDWLSGVVERAAADVDSVASGTVILTRTVGDYGRSSASREGNEWSPANSGHAEQAGGHGELPRAAAE
jgi:hypothetical protein